MINVFAVSERDGAKYLIIYLLMFTICFVFLYSPFQLHFYHAQMRFFFLGQTYISTWVQILLDQTQ